MRIKLTLLIILGMAVGASPLWARSLTIQAVHPSPTGQYDTLKLSPQSFQKNSIRCTSQSDGTFIYNSDLVVLQFCDGSSQKWRVFGEAWYFEGQPFIRNTSYKSMELDDAEKIIFSFRPVVIPSRRLSKGNMVLGMINDGSAPSDFINEDRPERGLMEILAPLTRMAQSHHHQLIAHGRELDRQRQMIGNLRDELAEVVTENQELKQKVQQLQENLNALHADLQKQISSIEQVVNRMSVDVSRLLSAFQF